MSGLTKILTLSLSFNKDSVKTLVDTLSYDLIITNRGFNTAFDVTLSDTLPQFVSAFVFSRTPVLMDGNVAQWHFDSLAAGSSEKISCTASVHVLPADTTLFLVYKSSFSAFVGNVTENSSIQSSVVAAPAPPAPAAIGDTLKIVPASLKAVYSDADPRCSPNRRLTDTLGVQISETGLYRISVLAKYSVGLGNETIE